MYVIVRRQFYSGHYLPVALFQSLIEGMAIHIRDVDQLLVVGLSPRLCYIFSLCVTSNLYYLAFVRSNFTCLPEINGEMLLLL